MNTVRPIIVLGAARSGTKLLRDALGEAADVAPVPYDINYVWRVGSEDVPHDQLDPTRAARASPYIRRKVQEISKAARMGRRPLEKTVSNALRIPYVLRVYPEAQFVWLVRDGRDVTESAMRCWTQPPTSSDLAFKLRAFPFARNTRYAVKYAHRWVVQRLSDDGQVSSWGPIYPGMAEDVQRLPLAEVCALQWSRTVEAYLTHRRLLPADTIEVRYEDLVQDPMDQLGRLADALHIGDFRAVELAAGRVVSGNVGKHRTAGILTPRVSSVLEPTLRKLGYTEEPT